jgi:UDP-2,3-diacylglucosamine pyrophosphatase LpxH
VDYITGNHDEMLRKFVGFKMGSFTIENKVLINLKKEKAWIFHGDVFDITMQHSKWIAKLGAIGYDSLIVLNSAINFLAVKCGKQTISMSKKIKNSVKSAVKFINNFEQIAAEIAIENKYDYVICGHIHQPEIKEITTDKGKVVYLNSGDWVENLTALEYTKGKWRLYTYEEDFKLKAHKEEVLEKDEVLENNVLFNALLQEFKMGNMSTIK